MSEYLIYDQNSHVQVFLVQAGSEEQAWNIYLLAEHGYAQGPNGYVENLPHPHPDLQHAFDTYGLMSLPDGSVSDPDARRFRTLEEALDHYNILQQADGSYLSYGVRYENLFEALGALARGHRLDIQKVEVRQNEKFQLLFACEEWEYLSRATPSEIADAHHKQSVRYQAIGDIQSAIKEEDKALTLLTDRRASLSCLMEIARLCLLIEKFDKAAAYYRRALEMSIEQDNQEQIEAFLSEAREKSSN